MKILPSIEISQLRTRSKKNSRKKKVNSKQNVCEDRWRYRSGYTLPSPQLAASIVLQAGPAAFFHGVIQTIGKTPLTT
jgi:hypothetical protein